VVASSYRLELSQAEAGALFDRLDVDQSGALSRRELGVWGGVKGAWGTYQANAKQRAATKQEAKKAAAKVNIQAGTPSLADLFQLLDTDRNGLKCWPAPASLASASPRHSLPLGVFAERCSGLLEASLCLRASRRKIIIPAQH
jgi:hypothetical protein